MPLRGSVLALVLAATALAGCQTAGTGPAQLPAPVAGQAPDVIEGGGETTQDYDLVPGPDGRVFLVLDCAAAAGSQVLEARRADGAGWGPASPEPQLTVPCDADGQRLAILGRGTPGQAIPVIVQTAGDQWRVAQTYQQPGVQPVR